MNQSREKMQNICIMAIDLICLLLSYVMAGYLWLGIIKGAAYEALRRDLYGDISAMIIAYAVTALLFNFNQEFIKRGKLIEIIQVIKSNIIIAAVMAVVIFLKHENSDLSRGVYMVMICLNVVVTYGVHRLFKTYLLKYYKNSRANTQLFVVTTLDRASKVIKEMDSNSVWGNRICSIAIIDRDMVGQKIDGVEVAATFDSMVTYAKEQIVDEVFIDVPYDSGKSLTDIVTKFEGMGATVHLNIEVLEQFSNFSKSVNQLGSIPVITFANNVYDYRQLFIKRLMDIVGSIVGLAITGVITIFLAPILKLESPGPLFFKQKRVGKNGRYFYIYKFRSMYVDAEERKKELMDKNKMDGLMFKMDNDPRITKVGRFIRKTSIDELPQFFNVLKGDMSLVGTRPPLPGEVSEYEIHHRARLAIKPGITGMWQVSGRSDITDFEEVVRLDTKYIKEWTPALDIKILFKTVKTVLGKEGSM